MTKNNRRDFIKLAGLTALGLSSPVSSLFKLNAIKAAALDNSGRDRDYKALVCLYLGGGNDSFNMLIPFGDAEYNEYAVTRSNLAIPKNDIIPIDVLNGNGKTFGLHPDFPDVATLFNNNHLAFINNTGTLVQPTTKEEYLNNSVPLPLGLFSHSDQTQQWQTAVPDQRIPVGWAGRLADLMHGSNSNPNIPMNISLSGTNIFQYGNSTVEFSIDPYGGSESIYGYGANWGVNPGRTQGIDMLLNRQYNDIYEKTYIDVLKGAHEGSLQFREAIEAVPDFNTVFEVDQVSQSFHMVAKVIAARETLGFERQIFFIRYDGWDHHDELLNNQAEMLTFVNNGLKSFAEVLNELGVFDQVTTFSMSDFSRTLTSNGNGTDHAWGGNVMVMGGAVNGKTFYGEYPSLELNSEAEVGDGVMLPTTANDLYFAELALWLGVTPSELSTIIPNIGNFYDVSSGNPPLGFLNI
jgi:uncharacterized protein (DUF1501 family)